MAMMYEVGKPLPTGENNRRGTEESWQERLQRLRNHDKAKQLGMPTSAPDVAEIVEVRKSLAREWRNAEEEVRRLDGSMRRSEPISRSEGGGRFPALARTRFLVGLDAKRRVRTLVELPAKLLTQAVTSDPDLSKEHLGPVRRSVLMATARRVARQTGSAELILVVPQGTFGFMTNASKSFATMAIIQNVFDDIVEAGSGKS